MDGRTRKLLAALAAVALLATAGCAGLAGGQTDASTTSEDAPERTIEVSAGGEATAEPDRATLTVSVLATGDNPEEVRQSLAERDDGLRDALIEWGVAEDRIRTEYYSIRETRESRERPNVTTYEGQHRYEVVLHDVEAVGEVIDVAVDAGADGVDRISFGLSDEREQELREEALENAMENADADAAVLANSSGLTVDGVYAVSTAQTSVNPYTTRYAAETAEAGDAATGVETGDVSVSVDVRVVYEASES
ncbi:hypothetical protein GCM10027435_06130 [Haloparvum alkalitolerans]|uniref:SIMPL domain-containing protein n=1 Tax=Haloparvum alkalitolerans TaxID=1042953 RepID=UPI003CFBB4DE